MIDPGDKAQASVEIQEDMANEVGEQVTNTEAYGTQG